MGSKVQRAFIAMVAAGCTFVGLPEGYAANAPTVADQTARTVLDDSLWVSPRADGMAGAIAPLADGDEAPYYNPAGIGGTNPAGAAPAIRHLNFPFIGASVNQSALGLRHDMSTAGTSDPALTEAILNAKKDQRQYGRVSFVPSIGISHLYLGYIMDTQVAALSLGNDTNMVRTHYRSQSGPGVGFSACDAHQRLCLGAFGAYLNRTEVEGDFSFDEINDPTLRKAALKRESHGYQGTSGDVGATWQMGKVAKPKFAVVAHDVGDTRFKADSADTATVVQKESLSAAFALSPEINRSAAFHFVLQGNDLTENSTSMEKKMRVGMELTLGAQNAHRPVFGLRAGYASAGASYGMNFDLGMLEFAASSYAVDIGTANNTVIERRYSATFAANIGEF